MPRLADYHLFYHRLVLAVFGYFFVFLFTINVDPAAVTHWLFPHSYLPFAALVFLADFFFFSFLWQSKFNGFVSTCWLQTYIFLVLQKVVPNPVFIFLFALPWMALLIFRYFTTRKFAPTQNK